MSPMPDWKAFKAIREGRKTTSISRIGSMDACPLLYHNRYELRTPEAESTALILGSLWNDMICGYPVENVPSFMEIKLQEYQHRFPEPLIPVNIQIPAEIEIPDTEYSLIGFIDYLDPAPMVVEYKFAMSPWSQKKAEAFYTTRQVYGYCWAADVPKYEFRVANLETDEIQVFPGEATKRNISDTVRWIQRTIAKVESGNRNPAEGPLCDYCGFKKTCPLFEGMPEEEDPNIEMEDDDYGTD